MTTYKKLDDYTLQAVTDISENSGEWGAPRLRRIFNFRAREVITLYERGGIQDFTIPGNTTYNSKTGYSAAVTSAMNSRSFGDYESQDEIIAMYAELVRRGGKPPALEDITGQMKKKITPLRAG